MTEPAEVILSVIFLVILFIAIGNSADWLEEWLRDKIH